MSASLRQALHRDRAAIKQLLARAQLSTEDLQETAWNHFLVLANESTVIGTIGLEVYGEAALLRSLVVDAQQRGHGHGKQLVAAAENRAQSLGARTLFLLTNTATDFFAAMSYQNTSRESAPTEIQQHAQLRTLCPASAAFMSKLIEPRR